MKQIVVSVSDDLYQKIENSARNDNKSVPETALEFLKTGMEWDDSARLSPKHFRQYVLSLQNMGEHLALSNERLLAVQKQATSGLDIARMCLAILVGDEAQADTLIKARQAKLDEFLKNEVKQ